MSRLNWDGRDYGAGLSRGVFYSQNGSSEVWNGLISVVENPNGNDQIVRYLDGIKYNYRRHLGYFDGTIDAYTYPDLFYDNVLTQTLTKSFGLSYRTESANSYKIHFIYNVSVTPSSLKYPQTSAAQFSWSFVAMPIDIPGGTKSAHIIVDASLVNPGTLAALEDILYGTETDLPRLPLPDEVVNLIEADAVLKVTDNGDGTFTATGPDDVIQMLDPTTFQISWPSAVYIDSTSYTLSTL
jgi:hypothetical protein